MKKAVVDIRRHGPLRKRSGVTTAMDVFERDGMPTARTREFRDALTRAGNVAVPGIPFQAKEWNWGAR